MRPVPAADRPTILHLTHQRAGSQWVYQVLVSALAGRAVARPLPRSAQILAQPILPGAVYPTVYATRQEVDALDIPGPQRRLFVMRDLRDTLVSSCLGMRHSHPDMNDPLVIEHVLALRARPIAEALRYEMHWQLRRIAAIQLSWCDSGVPVIRFEELARDGERAFARLLGHCGVELTRRQLAALLAPASFEARSGGRSPGVEELGSHERKGIVGDWREHLRGDLLAEFKELFDDVLVETGYEAGTDWGAVARPPRSRDAAPGCWCGEAATEPHPRGFRRCPSCGTLVSERGPGGRPPVPWDSFAPSGAPGMLDHLDLLLRWLPAGAGVLDAGGAPAGLLALLAEAGMRVVAAAPGDGGLDGVDGAFDAVVLGDLLSRAGDPPGLLGAARDRLAPGGVVVVAQGLARDAAGSRGLRELTGAELLLLRPGEYRNVFTPGSLAELLRRSGLAAVHREDDRLLAAAEGDGRPPAPRPGPQPAFAEALRGLRREAELAEARQADERRMVVAQQRAVLEAGAPSPLVEDQLGLGAGWHEPEQQDGERFRWAGEDAEITVANPSGRMRALELELEPGPGVGGGAYELALVDGRETTLARARGPRGRHRVRLALRLPAGPSSSVRLRASPGGRPSPGDHRILNVRLFAIGWTGPAG